MRILVFDLIPLRLVDFFTQFFFILSAANSVSEIICLTQAATPLN